MPFYGGKRDLRFFPYNLAIVDSLLQGLFPVIICQQYCLCHCKISRFPAILWDSVSFLINLHALIDLRVVAGFKRFPRCIL